MKWNQLEDTVKVLKVLYEITIKLQKASCTLSDFYGFCLWAHLKLSKMQITTTNLHHKMLAAMEERKKSLLQNKAMLFTVYFVPRFKSDLTDDQIAVKIALGNIWDELNSTNNQTERPINEENELIETNANEEDLVEQHFAQMENPGQNAQMSRLEFFMLLDEYEQAKRLHHSSSVLKFWEDQKCTMPHIYDVASIFHAIKKFI